MMPESTHQSKTLYDTDYNLWVLETVQKLQDRDLDAVDWENLIEEVLDLSKGDKRELDNLLTLLFEHLLKLKCCRDESERNKAHCRGEITNFRIQIRRLLKDSPSLKNYLSEKYDNCYQDARELVSAASGLPLNTFPENAIADLEQVLDENWFP